MNRTEYQPEKALRLSICDGAFAAMMASLAGGVFLVGFAINVLEANTVQVGILAALPISANLVQFFGSIILETFGKRRLFCVLFATIARLLWVFIMLLPLALFDGFGDVRVWLLVIFVGVSSLFGALAGVAWLEWTSDLVPPNIRGTFFGRRNMFAAAAGMMAVLAGGAFLNRWELAHGKEDPRGYLILFGVGIVLGLVSSAFLFLIPDPKAQDTKPSGPFRMAQFMGPFRDGNFRALVMYVGAFMFATQLAGPFYAVYMIETLSIDFSTITWFITFATLASLFMLRVWGPIADEFGNKPILIVAGLAHALIPLSWVVAQTGIYFWPITVAHVLSGMFYAALMLAHLNILIKLAPEKGRSVYIAVFNGVIGLSVAVAPIVGGWLLNWMSEFSVQVGRWELNNLHLLFLFSGVLQIGVLTALFRLHEEGAAAPQVVLLQLRNDLDPQTGIAGVTDFVSVNASRSTGVLRGWDERTDRWAEQCEARMERALDRVEEKTGVFSRLKRYVSEV